MQDPEPVAETEEIATEPNPSEETPPDHAESGTTEEKSEEQPIETEDTAQEEGIGNRDYILS